MDAVLWEQVGKLVWCVVVMEGKLAWGWFVERKPGFDFQGSIPLALYSGDILYLVGWRRSRVDSLA